VLITINKNYDVAIYCYYYTKAFKVKDAEAMMNLPMKDADELIRSYTEEYAPFYNKHFERKDRLKEKKETAK